jgi:hypothetical protein
VKQQSPRNVSVLGIDPASFESPDEKAAAELLLGGSAIDAIAKLDKELGEAELSTRSRDFQRLYVVALVVSGTARNLLRARDHVTKIGELPLLANLSVSFWVIGDTDSAIVAARDAISALDSKAFSEQNDETRARWEIRTRSNLAYFLAERQEPDRAQEARALIQRSLSLAKEKWEVISEGRELYRDTLDTAGFVLISFAASREDIDAGLTHCEDARRLGSDVFMYAAHVERAVRKASDLKAGKPAETKTYRPGPDSSVLRI